MKYNAVEKSEFIDNELKGYIKSTFQIQDDEFLKLFNESIDNTELMKGPYVSISHPFVSGSSIEDLVKEGVLSNEILKMKELNLKRPLYLHQEESIRKSNDGKNIVVSTGTGSGKTESFLIPILNDIAKDIEQGIENRGVQALLLYPMNALANDQRERLREILKNYPEISFGFFTGETDHTEREAINSYVGENNRQPLKNEIISREAIRNNPPNILFTNYSMLEYLMIRPIDQNLFTVDNTKNWKYIVLDEAHVYRGALGIEISLLIRRLLANIHSKPKFILTSATLANKEEDFPEVVDFATRLTSQTFDNDSIIVATREIRVNHNDNIILSSADYSKMFEDDSHIIELYRDKIDSSNNSINIDLVLNMLIKKDLNYQKFIDILSKPRTIKEASIKMGDFTENNILTMLNLISRLSKDYSLKLVDIKYHTFIKTVDSALVTVKPKKTLELRNTAKHSDIDNDGNVINSDVFTLGVCKYCKEPYLIGQIVNNKFYDMKDEELYEQFDDRFLLRSDMLLLNVESLSLDKDKEDLRTMILCNKCSYIYDKDNLNATGCGCGDNYAIETIMYKENNRSNISECLSCDSKSNRGVIESFYIGKDSATSLIAQFLYKKMGLKNYEESTDEFNEITDFFKVIEDDNNIVEANDSKQIIAFSDSRQQASFFATYFESNHLSFLKSRLIIKIMEDRNRLTVDDILREVNYIIDKENLFPDNDSSINKAWIVILTELLNIKRFYSLNGLGLLGIEAKHDYKNMTSKDVEKIFPEMTFNDFKNVIQFIINSMRSIPAINYFEASKLTYEERMAGLSYRGIDNAGLTIDYNDINRNTKSLLPKTDRGNIYTDYLIRSFKIDYELSKKYLTLIGSYLFGNSKSDFIEKNEYGAFVYNYKGFEFINYKNVDWYICDACRSITSININDTCVRVRCKGSLVSIDPDEVNKSNYYYKEYLTKEIERIRVEEHTAQLDSKKAREYQRDFKNGDINILSSSTTFEMGVDIGDLDSVYMRNVPPTPSNYIQRAGRAGRRSDTSAYVLTFCSTNSHDYTYFETPIKMIEGKITPPYFEVKNEKIIDRHILSTTLAMFFKINPEFFENAEKLIEMKGLENFKEYVWMNKSNIVEYVSSNIDGTFKDRFDLWFDKVFELNDSPIVVMEKDYMYNISSLKTSLKNGDLTEWEENGVHRALANERKESVINVLSKYNVIPKYGFPIDSVELSIPQYKKNYDVNRDLSAAISEYAPESEVIVDKKKFKSRYIATGKNRTPIKYYYKICDTCQTLAISMSKYSDSLSNCKNCKENLENSKVKEFIKPIYGFITEKDEMTDKTLKPKRTYSSDFYYIGNSEEVDYEELIEDIVSIKSLKDNHLALINTSNFFTCENCGYTVINNADSGFNSIRRDHNVSGGTYECGNDILIPVSLGHEFRTDIVLVEFVVDDLDYGDTSSVMYALLEGVSNALEIDRNDISGITLNIKGKTRIILFDNVPGGAGHVKRLLNKDDFIKVMRSSYKKVSQECCDESTSCYNCLRNYNNRNKHGDLVRGLAKSFFERFDNIIN